MIDVHEAFAAYFFKDDIKIFASTLSKKLEEGHICVHLDEVLSSEALAQKNTSSKKTLKNKFLCQHIVSGDPQNKQPFIVHNDWLYMQRYFHYESVILDRVLEFMASGKENFEQRIDLIKQQKEFIQNLFPNEASADSLKKPNWQLVAAISAFMNNFTIITGGPGTGKTTTVAKILALLYSTHPDLKVALAAPTGKAAAQMAESIANTNLNVPRTIKEKFQSLKPATLHRLLGADFKRRGVKYDKNSPLEYDLVVVDESSMIDVAFFAKLLDAIGTGTRLILLGDKDQLASVEAGSLFGDLCNAQQHLNLFSKDTANIINYFIRNKDRKINNDNITASSHTLFEHVIELRHSHRFQGDKGIGRFSKAVISNDTAVINEFLQGNNDEEVSIDITYSDKVFEKFAKGYESYIKEKNIIKALQKLNNQRILCATREGDYGLYATSRRVESMLQQKGLINTNQEFYEHRPIMITRNYYDLQLFNGDIGIIRKDETDTLKAFFIDSEGKLTSFLPGFVSNADTVFAMTIHKSQGSEFDNVLVMLPDNQNIALMTRELLYTAVTRAKNQVFIQGTGEVILATSARQVTRASGIKDRFDEAAVR